MITKQTKGFQYNGLGFFSSPITPIEVIILGVTTPVDPGFVTILKNGKQELIELKDCPLHAVKNNITQN